MKIKMGVYLAPDGRRALSSDGDILYVIKKSINDRGIDILFPLAHIGFTWIGDTMIDEADKKELDEIYKAHSLLEGANRRLNEAIRGSEIRLDKYKRFRNSLLKVKSKKITFQDAVRDICFRSNSHPSEVLKTAEDTAKLKGCSVSEALAFLWAQKKFL